MNIIEPLVLIGIIALALNHAGGGKPHHVIRPATGILNSLARLGLKIGTQFIAVLSRAIGSSIRVPGVPTFKTGSSRPAGPPQPRWRS